MASVHRRPRSPFWHAAFRGPDGRLILRSTKRTKRGEAEAVAMEWERAANLAKQGLLVESQARAVVAAIMERAGGGDQLRTPATATFLREWLAAKETSRATRTATRYAHVVEGFIEHLGDRASRPLVAVTPGDVQRYVDARIAAKCAAGTVEVDGKILRTAFNRARRLGLIASNPCEAVELPGRDSVERGTFSLAEIGMLVDAAKGEWRTLILLGAYTGQRLMDCARLEWSAVDFSAGVIRFAQEKTSARVVVPMHAQLREHLEGLAGSDAPERFVMPGMAAKGGSGCNGLSESFKRLVVAAGLDLGTVKRDGGRNASKRTFHALRHSFASALANAGVPEEVRMKLTGHKSKSVHATYTHHEAETLRAAIGKLPGLSVK